MIFYQNLKVLLFVNSNILIWGRLYMEFEFNAENFSKPWFRLVVGIILVLAGIFCLTNPDIYSGITRESCTEAEVTLYEMRFKPNNRRYF